MNYKFLNWKRLVPNFELEELASPAVIEERLHERESFIYSAVCLQQFRYFVDVPLLVNHGNHHLRGMRTRAEQDGLIARGLSSAQRSYHLDGRAFDISTTRYNISTLLYELERFNDRYALFGGIGIYDTFLHVDTRPAQQNVRAVVWDNRSNG